MCGRQGVLEEVWGIKEVCACLGVSGETWGALVGSLGGVRQDTEP